MSGRGCEIEMVVDCACDQVAAALTAAGVEVEYVVNNAGFGLFGTAAELNRAVGTWGGNARSPAVSAR